MATPTVMRRKSDLRIGLSTAAAGSPMPTVHPVSGDRLQAENDGVPSSSCDRNAPSGAV